MNLRCETNLSDRKPVNPTPLCELWFSYNQEGTQFFRLVLLTADNIPLPYYLVQFFDEIPDSDELDYILNWAVYPNLEALQEIGTGAMNSIDLVINAMELAHIKNIKMYRVDNGRDYTDMMLSGRAILVSKVGEIDTAIRNWLNQ